MPSLLRVTLFATWLPFVVSRVASLTAWQTSRGPAIAYQAQSTNNSIAYSLCTTNSSVVAPGEAPYFFPGTDDALYATSLAVVGWTDQTTNNLWASLFYQSATRDIVNAQYMCNNETGQYELQVSQKVTENRAMRFSESNGGEPDVLGYTGLAILLLTEGIAGDQQGHYLFYEDYEQRLQMIHAPGQPYRPQWTVAQVEPLGPSAGPRRAMFATASISFDPHSSGEVVLRLLSVAGPSILQLSTLEDNGSWENSTILIHSLGWDNELDGLGLGSRYGTTEGHDQYVTFYIGNDNLLHMTFAIFNDSTSNIPIAAAADGNVILDTKEYVTVDTDYNWPASAPSSAFGMVTTETASGLQVHIFYESENGALMEAVGSIDDSKSFTFQWHVSSVAQAVPDGLVSTSSSSSATPSSTSSTATTYASFQNITSSTESLSTSTSSTSTSTSTSLSASFISLLSTTSTTSTTSTSSISASASPTPFTPSATESPPVPLTCVGSATCLWPIVGVCSVTAILLLVALCTCRHRQLQRRRVQQHPSLWDLPVGLPGTGQSLPLEPLQLQPPPPPPPPPMPPIPPLPPTYIEISNQDGKSMTDTTAQTETVRTVVTTTTTTTTKSEPEEVGVPP